MDGIDAFMKALPQSRATGPRLCEGEVLESGESPLRVQADGLVLEAADLMVNGWLVWEWSIDEDEGQPELLRPGDRVLLLASADAQTYYILCKVVSAE